MKRFIGLIALAAAAQVASAQDIYQIESLTTEDLNGTARYVGMGGAMSALGADLSVMSTNPAGIGLFRRSELALSGSIVKATKGVDLSNNKAKSTTSFDNIGFVYSAPMGSGSVPYFNVGFNYHKRKNFNGLFSDVQNFANGTASITNEMSDLYSYWLDQRATNPSPFAMMGYNTGLIVADPNQAGNYLGYVANEYKSYRKSTGGIEQYDFNFSFNIKEQFYLGLTVSAYNIDKHTYSTYGEGYFNPSATSGYGDMLLVHDEVVSGSGFDVKLGAIIRPVYDSPFRIGLSVTTPTWYNIDYNTSAEMANYAESASDVSTNDGYNTGISYNLRTPWKFNLSLGHTIGNYLALGAEYEYADLSTSKVSYDTGYDMYGVITSDDHELNSQTKKYLKGQSTFKIGAELKPSPEWAVRVGYNHVSSPIDPAAYYNQFIDSRSIDHATQASYMNLSSINRYTAGIGYRGRSFYADLAYQFQSQSGDYYPFFSTSQSNIDLNEVAPSKINLNRSQLLLTLGFRF